MTAINTANAPNFPGIAHTELDCDLSLALETEFEMEETVAKGRDKPKKEAKKPKKGSKGK